MNNKSIFTIVLLAGLLLIQACKKDRTTVYVNKTQNTPGTPVNPVVPTPSQFTTLADFYKTLRPSNQSFNVNIDNGGTVRGDRGYTFQFAPNSFMYGSGMPVTGNIKIELIEVTNYAEMMGTSARTEAVNGILGSAAMFKIRATQNGQEIYPTLAIKASIPVNKDAILTNIAMFTGNVTGKDSSVKWSKDSAGFYYNADSLKKVYDSLNKIYEEKRIIKFDIYFCGWCNLDAYYNNAGGCQIRVKFSGIANVINSEVYMKLNQSNLKGLYKLTYDQTLDEFNSTYYNLPPGWNIHLIVLVKDKDKKIYLEDRTIVNATTTHGFSNLKEISDADLESFFKGLN